MKKLPYALGKTIIQTGNIIDTRISSKNKQGNLYIFKK